MEQRIGLAKGSGEGQRKRITPQSVTPMSEREIAKKECEEHDLYLFLKEHARVTGIRTHGVVKRESPDFELRRGDTVFGVELVQVIESPEDRSWRVVLNGSETMVVPDASDGIQEAIYRKEEKRRKAGWGFPESTILVVHLRGCSGEDVFAYWDETILAEISKTGFVEIWLCDHGPEEAYRTVELIGVKPSRWRGVHRHSGFGGKPYG